MGSVTGIQWTDRTFNPWWGCTKVSPGCAHCYAESWDARTGGAHWGAGVPRRTFGDRYWSEPLRWNAEAAASDRRLRVFCASMADVFDAEAPPGALERLWNLIRATPHLDWQLLTKRAERIVECLPADWGGGWPHVWLGVSVENSRWIDRYDILREIPTLVRFVSAEPLLAWLDIWRLIGGRFTSPANSAPNWVIVGGESGPQARPLNLTWIEEIVRACEGAEVACFVKQLGSVWARRVHARDAKGGDITEWPAGLRVRQFPAVGVTG